MAVSYEDLIKKDVQATNDAQTEGARGGRAPGTVDYDELVDPRNRQLSVQKPEDDSYEIVKGISSGIDVTQGLTYGVGGLIADAADSIGIPGAAGVRDDLLEGYKRNMAEAEANAPRVTDIRDINDVNDFTDWFMGSVGQLIPTAATMIGTGFVAGAIARYAGKKALTAYEKKLIERNVTNAVAKRALQRAAAKIEKNVAKAQLGGAWAGSSALETGEIYGDVATEDGVTGAKAILGSLAGGVLAGSLDVLPVMQVAKRFGFGGQLSKKLQTKLSKMSLPQRMGSGAMGTALFEGTTEGLQTYIEEQTKALIAERDIPDDIAMMMMNAAAMGMAGGSVFGAVGGIPSQSVPADDSPEKDGLTIPDKFTFKDKKATPALQGPEMSDQYTVDPEGGIRRATQAEVDAGSTFRTEKEASDQLGRRLTGPEQRKLLEFSTKSKLPAPEMADGHLTVSPEGVARPSTKAEKDTPRAEYERQGIKIPANMDDERIAQPEYRERLTTLSEFKMPDKVEVNPETDNIMTAITKLGGLNIAESKSQGIDPAYFKDKKGAKNPFRKGGKSFDAMAEALSQHGYTPSDYSANDLLDKVSLSLSGEVVNATGYNPDSVIPEDLNLVEGYTPEKSQRAIKKALEGGFLGGKELEAVNAALDLTDKNIDARLADKKNEAKLFLEEINPTPVSQGDAEANQAPPVDKDYGFKYDEQNYTSGWDGGARTFHDLFVEANKIDPEASKAIIDKHGEDETLIPASKSLLSIIQGSQNEEQANAGDSQTGEQEGVQPAAKEEAQQEKEEVKPKGDLFGKDEKSKTLGELRSKLGKSGLKVLQKIARGSSIPVANRTEEELVNNLVLARDAADTLSQYKTQGDVRNAIDAGAIDKNKVFEWHKAVSSRNKISGLSGINSSLNLMGLAAWGAKSGAFTLPYGEVKKKPAQVAGVKRVDLTVESLLDEYNIQNLPLILIEKLVNTYNDNLAIPSSKVTGFLERTAMDIKTGKATVERVTEMTDEAIRKMFPAKELDDKKYEPTAKDDAVTDLDEVDETLATGEISVEDFKEITNEWAALFANPDEKVITENVTKDFLTPEEAKARIAEWKAHVQAQFDNNKGVNSDKTILSLFDLSGEWVRPYVEAGYNVIQFDIQNGQDINDFSVEYFNENWDFGEVYGIIAACPCTDFASSGARHFAGKDKSGATEASKELVFQTLRTIEYFRPNFWVLENPVGRIEKLAGLPKARMTFQPHNFGETYTKKTMLWGKFNANLPTANVEPTEGSKMHQKYGGKSQATKNARSKTPEGFAYAFFMGNNYVDATPEQRLVYKYPEASGAIKAALKSGVTEDRIVELMEETYENFEYKAARDALLSEVSGKKPTPPTNPETEGRRTKERADETDRRVDESQRKRIDDMSIDEARQELRTDGLTGLGSNRAYQESDRKPIQVAIDADSLKWINDNMSMEAGNDMLRAIGKAIKEETNEGYHPTGDEFFIQSDTREESESLMRRITERLKDVKITVERPDGEVITKSGVDITYAIEKTEEKATYSLKNEKTRREAAGLRAGREEKPGGVVRKPAEGIKNSEDRAARQEPEQPVIKKPSNWGAKNKLFTKDAAKSALDLLKSKRNQLNAGIDPEMMLAGLTLAGYHIEAGARSFAEYSRAMIDDLGTEFKPFIKYWYENVRTYPGFDSSGMSSEKEIALYLKDESNQVETDKTQEGENYDIFNQPERTGVEGLDTVGVPEVSAGRGDTAQSGNSPSDAASLEDVPQVDVQGAESGRDIGADGVRVPAEDVGTGGGEPGVGNVQDGRTGASGTGMADAGPGGRTGGKPSPARNVGNLYISDPKSVVGGGQVARFGKNQSAIELYQDVISEGRQASIEEQSILSGYTGWGSFGQELFKGSWGYPQPKKGWEARDEWLRDHLGKKEWESAQNSIINAHYTDAPTVMAMWSMLQRMGFKGGRILEPSMGIGNFFGLMPPSISRRSNLDGIELDELTGGMAKLIYPDANISIKGYQESKTPDNFYDVVIGNWPFANFSPADRRYSKISPVLHDYFFLKALDQVRPGGIVIGITSKGTMDKVDLRSRLAIAKKAELVTMFRLPSGAFKDYAGTSVVTDIIILKKRDKPIGIVDDIWKNVEEITLRGEKVKVNTFYVQNPDNVVGKLDYGSGTTSFRPGLIVTRPRDMEAQLERIIEMVPEGAYKPEKASSRITYISRHGEEGRQLSMVEKDGGFYQVRGEQLADLNTILKYKLKSHAATKKREKQFSELMAIGKKYSDLIDAERAGKGDLERQALNSAYEMFVKRHGKLNDSYGLKYLNKVGDSMYASIASLEFKVDGKYKKAKILSESVIKARRKIENPSIADAYIIARNDFVQPTAEDIASIAKKTPEEVKKNLIDSGAAFEMIDGDIQPTDIYLSGNVRIKLKEAESALESGNKAMAHNVKKLKEVIPKTVPYHEIEVQLGATWVADNHYNEYVAKLLGNEEEAGQVETRYKMGRWKIIISDSLNNKTEASAGYGSSHVSFKKLINLAITNQSITIRHPKQEDGTRPVNEMATAEVAEKISKIRNDFQEWVWQKPERRVQLEKEYNETRNSYAKPVFDGSFMDFDGMALLLGENEFNLRQHQADAIWRGVVTRRSLNAHEVGTGKTFTIGGIAIESRRYGIAKKPLLLAHNANSATVAEEIQQMYPSSKILYIDNLSPADIEVRLRQIRSDDWDLIVLPHSLISRLALKEETMMAMVEEELAALEAEAREAAEEDGVSFEDNMLSDEDELKKLRSPTAKDLVKTRNQIIENIKKQGLRSSREGAIPFEELGVDMILVDEAHEFKKPPIITKMRMKGLNTQASNKSIALRFLTRYVSANNDGGNVHLFTGTPITNTLTEVFHQMRYIMEQEMRDIGIEEWDGWFANFATEVNSVELNAAAEYEPVIRLASFINVPELRQLLGQYMDVVYSDDMPEMKPRRTKSGKLLSDKTLTDDEKDELLNGRTEGATDRPYKKVIVDTADMTDEQLEKFEYLRQLALSWRSMSGKQRIYTMRAGDPESPIITEGLASKAAFDVRLMRGEALAGTEGKAADDVNSKASRAIKNILHVYHSNPHATQAVFSELGLGKKATRSVGAVGEKSKVTYPNFSTIHDMVERLVSAGIPRDEIFVVTGNTSKKKRKYVAAAMNRGEIRIVFGSSQSLGVGVNMQKNLRAMHHLDAPWMPGSLEQRNGRGHRQGNQWNTVLEFRYLTDRLDGRRWQVLAVKQQFITSFMKANSDDRVIEGEAAEDEQSDILETFSEAAGDPRILLKEKAKMGIEKFERKERVHTMAMAEASMKIGVYKDNVVKGKEKLTDLKEGGTVEAVAAAIEKFAGDGFTATIGKKKYKKRKDAQTAINKFAKEELRLGKDPKKMGVISGFDVFASLHWVDASPALELRVPKDGGGEVVINTYTGSIASIESKLRSYGGIVDDIKESIAEAEKAIVTMKGISKETFRDQGKLDAAYKILDGISEDMENNPVPPPAWLRSGAPVGMKIKWGDKEFEVIGHRWTKDNWFVMGQDEKGDVQIPYNEVFDDQGMELYETKEFKKPSIVEKKEEEEPLKSVAANEGGIKKSELLKKLKAGRFGRPVAKMITDGDLNIVQGVKDLPPGASFPAGVAGATYRVDGESTIYLVADNIESSNVDGVFLHEVFHGRAKDVLGDKQYSRLMKKLAGIERIAKAGKGKVNKFFNEAYQSIPENTPESVRLEELAAYAIELYESAPQTIPQNIVKWIKDFIAAIRAALMQRGWMPKNVTPADLSAIARSSLKAARPVAAPEQATAPAFSGRPDTFYSGLLKAAQDLKQNKGNSAQMMAMLRKSPGVKADEISWLGLDDYLSDKKTVTKQEIIDFVDENQVRIEEVVKSGDSVYVIVDNSGYVVEEELHADIALATKSLERLRAEAVGTDKKYFIDKFDNEEKELEHENLQLPGGTNYREMLFILPEKLSKENVIYGIDKFDKVKFDETLSGWVRVNSETGVWDTLAFENKVDAQDVINSPVKSKHFTALEKDVERKHMGKVSEEDMFNILNGKEASLEILDHWETNLGADVSDVRADITGTNNNKTGFYAGHYDEKNVLAHTRFNERGDVLFIEELQSDWHAKGRKHGYISGAKKSETGVTLVDEVVDVTDNLNRVPDAPFKNSWREIVFRRLVRYAIERGKKEIAWTTGAQQAKRYDLSSKVKNIVIYSPEYSIDKGWENKLHISANNLQNEGVLFEELNSIDDAEAIIGKELTSRFKEQIEAKEWNVDGVIEFKGLDLEVGGDKLKNLYDKILVNYANKFGKKFGARAYKRNMSDEHIAVQLKEANDTIDFVVKKFELEGVGDIATAIREKSEFDYTEIPPHLVDDAVDLASAQDVIQGNPEEVTDFGAVHVLPITEKMRDSVLKGQPLFSEKKKRTPPADDKPFRGSESDLAEELLKEKEVIDRTFKQRANYIIDKLDGWLAPITALPDAELFMTLRNLAQGSIAKYQEMAKEINETFNKASSEDGAAIYDYFVTEGADTSKISDPELRKEAAKVKRNIIGIGKLLVRHGIISEEARSKNEDSYLPRVYFKYLLGEKKIANVGTGKTVSGQGYSKMRKDIPKEVRDIFLGEIKDAAYLASRAIAIPMRDVALLRWMDQIAKNDKWVLKDQFVEWKMPWETDGKPRLVTPMWLKGEAANIRKRARKYADKGFAKEAMDMAEGMDTLADAALEKSGIDIDGVPSGYEQMPNQNKYGALKGMIVRSEIYDDIIGIPSVAFNASLPEKILGHGGYATKFTQWWKWSKVAANPPAQVRNFVSNMILLHLSGVPMSRLPKLLRRGHQEISKKGKYYKIGLDHGLSASTFAANEMLRIERDLINLEVRAAKDGFSFAHMKLAYSIVVDFTGDLYQYMETLGKTMKIMYEMEENGVPENEAVNLANKWLFDYSLVTQGARFLRNFPIGVPFITFYLKVLPRLIETAVNRPQAYLPYVALIMGAPMALALSQGVDDDDIDALKKALPLWLQEKGHAMILPIKDANGRWQAVDLGYFFPWTMYTQMVTDLYKGEIADVFKSTGIFGGPVPNLISAISTNTDPFTHRKIMDERDTPQRQLASILTYLYGMAMPPWLVGIPFLGTDPTYKGASGHLYRAITGHVDKYGDPSSTMGQAAFRFVGVNIYPIDATKSRANNLYRMNFEIKDVRRRMLQLMRDRNISTKERKKIQKDYTEKLVGMQKDLVKYQKESKVNPKLLQE